MEVASYILFNPRIQKRRETSGKDCFFFQVTYYLFCPHSILEVLFVVWNPYPDRIKLYSSSLEFKRSTAMKILFHMIQLLKRNAQWYQPRVFLTVGSFPFFLVSSPPNRIVYGPFLFKFFWCMHFLPLIKTQIKFLKSLCIKLAPQSLSHDFSYFLYWRLS